MKPEETDGVKSLEAKAKALGLKVDSCEPKIKLMVGNIKKGRQKHGHEDS